MNKPSGIQIYLWAITHSDISSCRFYFNSPIKIFRTGAYKFSKISICYYHHLPQLAIVISDRVYEDYAAAHGLDVDFMIPF